MKRREFIRLGLAGGGGGILLNTIPLSAFGLFSTACSGERKDLYKLFADPGISYRPYVRWWWNGNKVEAGELIRELHLLKEAGIGGVEINPIEFPSRSDGDDLGKPSLQWLSPQWVEMLELTCAEAKRLGMTCDLLVGSGWPFGAGYLQGNERAQIVAVGRRELQGPCDYEVSGSELIEEADPGINNPFPERTFELLSLKLVPDPMTDEEQIVELLPTLEKGVFRFRVPPGKHILITLLKVDAFMKVINGAPGADGPVLNHYNRKAVEKYLRHMSDVIQNQSGPLRDHIRALFTDSMELEGSNWTSGMREEFIRRRGYDIVPFLPFLLYRIGAMGNAKSYTPPFEMPEGFREKIDRMRYDFELTKMEMLRDSFVVPYTKWCKELGVKSRAQAYGRGFFPLESSFYYDIPEGESWTMTWLRHRLGEEMPDSDYRRGRAYTMINKYVSSAAHLKDRRLVSCEEMTDTYRVFNTSLEMLKLGSDQSVISGISHSIFHGFNYSPPEVPFPGWIRYGAYYNENSSWWPFFRYFTEYKARLSAVLQNATMYADIALLTPLSDMWTEMGAQMEPFPSEVNVPYASLVWEAIHKNGGGCDYVSDGVIRDALVKEECLCYGNRKYHTLIMIAVKSLDPQTAQRICEFIMDGGRVFCIGETPHKSLGWKDHGKHDLAVREWVQKMSEYPERFVFLPVPEKISFLEWYGGIMEQYGLHSYVKILKPDAYLMQNRYLADDGTGLFFFTNSHRYNGYEGHIRYSDEITTGRHAWIWDPENGKRFRLDPEEDDSYRLTIGPAGSLLMVFDREEAGEKWQPMPWQGPEKSEIIGPWELEFRHLREEAVRHEVMEELTDLNDIPEYRGFCGTVVYRARIPEQKPLPDYINLGRVYGIARLYVNGADCGLRWYGNRIFDIKPFLKPGVNAIEIHVITEMGNYMRTLTDNPVAQYWMNRHGKEQPAMPMGLKGPVSIYASPYQ